MVLFDILKDINLNKSFSLHNQEDFEKTYNSFMINRFLSMNPETVFEAEMLNSIKHTPKKYQYLFLSTMIESKNRYLKYIKQDKESEDAKLLKCVSDYYYVSEEKARELLKTISEEEKEMIKQAYKDMEKSKQKWSFVKCKN